MEVQGEEPVDRHNAAALLDGALSISRELGIRPSIECALAQ